MTSFVVVATTLRPVFMLVLFVLRLIGTARTESQSGGADGYGEHPTTAVIYDDSDYVDADSPVYVSGDAANSKKFKMIKTLREGG
jgi:hypothetical protein